MNNATPPMKWTPDGGMPQDRSSAELSDQKSARASRTVQRSARVTRLRWLVRSLCLIAVILLMLPPTRALGLAWLVPAASPLVALASVISIRSFGWIALPGLAVAVIVVVRRRWFCRWMCPTGLLADIATHAGRQRGRSCPRLPPIGQWLALVTLGGAVLGYPMLLWLDPLALLSSSLGAVARVSATIAWLSAAGMLILLACNLIWPGVWCHRVCPLGATQDLLARVFRVTQQTAELDGRPGSRTVNSGMSRRFMLGTIVGFGWALIARGVLANIRSRIRPPGALNETRFVGLCVRCGNCTRACPTNIIQPDPDSNGVAGLLAPIVSFQDAYCHEDCTRCADVCPTGALTRFSVDDKQKIRMGVARVDMEVCLLAEDRECAACRNNCPFEAITYVWSESDYMLSPHVDSAKCPGCGACEVACPTRPVRAIRVVPGSAL